MNFLAENGKLMEKSEIENAQSYNPSDNYNCAPRCVEAEEDAKDDRFVSNFIKLYKLKPPSNQEKRRKELLETSKLRRNQTFDEQRDFSELLCDDESTEDFEAEQTTDEPEPMEVAAITKSGRTRFRTKVIQNFMLSEWFAEIPPDLEASWLVKLCPVGKRNLVIARKNKTQVFNKRRQYITTFTSLLPGGGGQCIYNNNFTILDCIYDKETKSYFMLDVLAWNGRILESCDTDFRFYWLKSKFEETPGLSEKSSRNKFPFINVESFPAELPLLEDKLASPYTVNDNPMLLDGVLFYHRQINYTQSVTPLVGWLKPFMIPEMLNIPVHATFAEKKPESYVTLQHYLSSQTPKNKKRTVKPQAEAVEMME